MLSHAALAARSIARADAAARLADLVETLMRQEVRGMRALPLSIGTIHFVGIGGIGMSGIAEVLHNLGYSRAGQRHRRFRQRPAPARGRHTGRHRP